VSTRTEKPEGLPPEIADLLKSLVDGKGLEPSASELRTNGGIAHISLSGHDVNVAVPRNRLGAEECVFTRVSA